jgi:antirestriction protein ArdC
LLIKHRAVAGCGDAQDEAHMKQEQALKLAEQALKGLAESLRGGRSEDLTKFLEVMARFPKYSLRNVMLIAAQRPDATHVAGFHAWRHLGRQVIKGEKGIGIVAPIAHRAKESVDATTAPSDDGSSERSLRGFRVVHVFDIGQTEGADLPDLARPVGDPGPRLAMLEDVVRRRRIELEYRPLPVGTFGLSAKGKIVMQPGLEPAEAFAVLAHELAHELLHQSTLSEAHPSKCVRETEAEAVAHVICHAFGLDSTRSSADYIQLYDGDLAALNGSLQAIQSTAAQILVEMSRIEAGYNARQASFVAA